MKNPNVTYVWDEGIVCGSCGEEAEINPDNGLCEYCDDSYKPEPAKPKPTHEVVDTMYYKSEPEFYYVFTGSLEECNAFVASQGNDPFYQVLPIIEK